MIKEIAREIRLSIKLSVKNCLINVVRNAPNNFLTPTSFARSTDLAVARLMKFIHAMQIIKIAIKNKNDTACPLPFTSASWL